ncbi:chemotaxis protein CheW [[Limnothrix rosea] IAM M-220]|uniref:chemotaxis protein CheW n=1 Tax=[Limnothrix rosea] IAM M-220 TaxID=454133 RepID=UPI00096169E5|nr:chemotaxis protein CheW [[Limnothrix rosea] IAM M-220]OKH19568.1 chemotaxis protein CheW [[Limnothrix rosea] IAM M-220]
MVGNTEFSQNPSPFGSEVQQLESPEGELHLRFILPSGMAFALPADGIREVMQQSPEQITPIPNVSPLLLGTINLRGQIIWVADLGQFLGDPTPLRINRPEIPVIAVEDQDTLLGLAVGDMRGMRWLPPENLQLQLNGIPDSMAPFIRGGWLPDEDEDVIWHLLDHVAVLRSARWAT